MARYSAKPQMDSLPAFNAIVRSAVAVARGSKQTSQGRDSGAPLLLAPPLRRPRRHRCVRRTGAVAPSHRAPAHQLKLSLNSNYNYCSQPRGRPLTPWPSAARRLLECARLLSCSDRPLRPLLPRPAPPRRLPRGLSRASDSELGGAASRPHIAGRILPTQFATAKIQASRGLEGCAPGFVGRGADDRRPTTVTARRVPRRKRILLGPSSSQKSDGTLCASFLLVAFSVIYTCSVWKFSSEIFNQGVAALMEDFDPDSRFCVPSLLAGSTGRAAQVVQAHWSHASILLPRSAAVR